MQYIRTYLAKVSVSSERTINIEVAFAGSLEAVGELYQQAFPAEIPVVEVVENCLAGCIFAYWEVEVACPFAFQDAACLPSA